LSLADRLSRSVIATSFGPSFCVTDCGGVAVGVDVQRPRSSRRYRLTCTPSTDCRSSSLAMTTSTDAHHRPHDRLRLRFGPELLAVVEVDADGGAGLLRGGERRLWSRRTPRSPSAGVMPVTWNHAAPFITASHFTASAGISLMAECARS
jgi:hypothetical protein